MGGVQPWPGGGQPWDPQPPAWQPAPTPQSAMRAAHTDRDRTVDVLKAAYAEGRLSAQEYSERFDAVNRAQTYGQLAQLVADLPSGPMIAPMGGAVPMMPQTFLPPPVYQPPKPTSGVAVTALVLGLLCVPTLGTLGVPAVITGHLAYSQARRTGQAGEGMALTGLVLGYLSLTGWVLLLLGLVTASVHAGG